MESRNGGFCVDIGSYGLYCLYFLYMKYAVFMKQSAEKELGKLPKEAQQAIMDRIVGLAHDPRPTGLEKMQGHAAAYRVRIGDYRAVYTIQDKEKTVTVEAIGDRKEIYRRY